MPQSSHNKRDQTLRGESFKSTPLKVKEAVGSGGPKHAFHTTFQFVNTNDTKESRTTVRKHVMREFRRRERWDSDKRQDKRQVSQGIDEVEAPLWRDRGWELSSTSSSNSKNTSSDAAGSPRIIDLDVSETLVGYASGEQYRTSHNDQSEDVQLSEIDTTSASDTMALGKVKDYPTYHADPWAAVAKSTVNPFSNINFNAGPSTQAFLYFFAYIMPSLMDADAADTNFHRMGFLYTQVAFHDPTPTHTMLYLVLPRLAGLYGLPDPPEGFEHKSKALRLIKERMDDPKDAMSNDTIGAILNLAAHEIISDNPDGFAVHMAGLRRMIRSRGGLEALHCSPELKMVVLRLDLLRAYYAASEPRYPRYTAIRALKPIAINIPPVEPHWLETSIPTSDKRQATYRFCEFGIKLIHGLEDVMLILGSGVQQTTKAQEEELRKVLLCSVVQLLRGDNNEISNLSRSSAYRCSQLAALILIDIIMRERFDWPPNSGRFIHTLRTSLLDFNAQWGQSMEMFAIIMSKTDRIALERRARAWYAVDVIMTVMNTEDETWIIIEQKLLEYIERNSLDSVGPPRISAVWNLYNTMAILSSQIT